MTRKRKSRSRKLRRSAGTPSSLYKNPIATAPSLTDSSSEIVLMRLSRIENNYNELDIVWADIESRIDFGDPIQAPLQNKPR